MGENVVKSNGLAASKVYTGGAETGSDCVLGNPIVGEPSAKVRDGAEKERAHGGGSSGGPEKNLRHLSALTPTQPVNAPPPSPAPWLRWWSFIAALALLPSCSLLYSYPDGATEDCRDKKDNDFDSAVDCDDSDCSEICDESTQCNDGQDNDLDGKADCLDDQCAKSASNCIEGANCTDGLDNDDDHQADCLDPDCSGKVPHCQEAGQCDDNIDNDNDGTKDCKDPDCSGLTPACVEGTHCWDGLDNDGDDQLDCADSDCSDACTEGKHCHDGIDNDGRGGTDCADPACRVACATGESGAEACSNGKDDDADDLTDCKDSDCAGFCRESDSAGCSNGWDDDGDGLTDAADIGCWPVVGAPTVTRCGSTEAVDWTETFDASDFRAPPRRYQLFGNAFEYWPPSDLNSLYAPGIWPTMRSALRNDSALVIPSVGSDARSGGVVMKDALDLADAFDVSFWTYVGTGGTLSVMFMPADTALGAQFEGNFTSASLGLQIRQVGAESPSGWQLALQSRGQENAWALQSLGPWWVRFSMKEGSVRATLRSQEQAASEAPAEYVIQSSPQPLLGLYRLVVRGQVASPGTLPKVILDDLQVRVPGRQPCGHREPEIWVSSPTQGLGLPTVGLTPAILASSDSCPSALLTSSTDVGHATSLAVHGSERCALVTVGARGLPAGGNVQSQFSADGGETWMRGEFPSPNDAATQRSASVSGVSVSRIGSDWLALVGMNRDSANALELYRSDDCRSWQSLASLPAAGAFSPNLVSRSGDQVDVLFFTGQLPNLSLFKVPLQTDRTFGTVQELSQLPPELGIAPPVSVQRIAGDWVLLASSASPNPPGLVLAVTPASGDAPWVRLPGPLLAPATNALTFDSTRLLSGSLAWDGRQGQLLYGATGSPFGLVSPGNVTAPGAIASVGVATLGAAGANWANSGALTAFCGDGICSAQEDCGQCARDCCSEGAQIIGTNNEGGWDTPATYSVYVVPEQGHAIVANAGVNASESSNSSRVLDIPVEGDFVLDFDVLLPVGEQAGADQSAPVRLGLAPSTLSSDGIFVEFHSTTLGCLQGDSPVDLVVQSHDLVWRTLDQPSGTCTGVLPAALGRTTHLSLVRHGGDVSLTMRDTFGCVRSNAGISQLRLLSPAGLERLEVLRVATRSSMTPLVLSNMILSHESCGAGQSLCPSGPDASRCVDMQSDANHCGGCGLSCGEYGTCVEGKCSCLEPFARCDAKCIDISSNEESCGACHATCGVTEKCVVGLCNGGTCEKPIPVEIGKTVSWHVSNGSEPSDEEGRATVFSWTAPKGGVYQVATSGACTDGYGLFCAVRYVLNRGCPASGEWEILSDSRLITTKAGDTVTLHIGVEGYTDSVNLNANLVVKELSCCSSHDDCHWVGNGTCDQDRCRDAAEPKIDDTFDCCCLHDSEDECHLKNNGICDAVCDRGPLDDSADCLKFPPNCISYNRISCSVADPCHLAGNGICERDYCAEQYNKEGMPNVTIDDAVDCPPPSPAVAPVGGSL